MVLSLLERHVEAERTPAAVIVQERSIRAASEVFLEQFAHIVPFPEYHLIKNLCSWAQDYFETGGHTVYLRCSPEVMVQRVVARSRQSERNLR